MAQDNERMEIEDQEQLQEEQTPEATESTEETEEQKDNSFIGFVYTWARELVGCLLVVVLIFTLVVRIIAVDGDSMLPTLHDQERVLLLSSNLYTEPETGDIVVAYSSGLQKPLVKRVIATEGQTVDIDFAAHEVWVDGELLDEPYIAAPTAASADVSFPQTVPEGHVFVMGDNRNNSRDSRDSAVGMVDTRCILGKVLLRISPWEKAGKIE